MKGLSNVTAGSGGFSVDEVVAVCFSLQRIADQALDSEETGRFFHDIIIPRLLTLALQAALQGKQKGFFAMKLQNMRLFGIDCITNLSSASLNC